MKLLISFLAGAIITGAIFYFGIYEPAIKKNKTLPSIEEATKEGLRGLSNILIDSATARTYINNYRADHDTLRDSTITYSVFFGRDVFRLMGKYFDTARIDVAGVGVFNIQYNDMIKADIYQKHSKQQSLLFMPQNAKGEILWTEWKKEMAPTEIKNLFDGFNHGSLCPNRCPTN